MAENSRTDLFATGKATGSYLLAFLIALSAILIGSVCDQFYDLESTGGGNLLPIDRPGFDYGFYRVFLDLWR